MSQLEESTIQDIQNLKILGCKAGSFCDSGYHLRPNFFIVVKRKHDVRPVGSRQRAVRAQTGASPSNQFSAKLRTRGELWRRARCSGGLERDVQKFGGGFAVFEPLGDHSEGQGLNAGDGLVTVRAVAHHASRGMLARPGFSGRRPGGGRSSQS